MLTITANDIKKQGVSFLQGVHEALVTVRGQPRYVILDIETYEKFREIELTAALQEAKEAIKKGRYSIESPADHIKRVTEE